MKTWFVVPYICWKTKQLSKPKGFGAGSGQYLAYGLLACSSRWGLGFLLGEALPLQFVIIFPSGSSPSAHLLDLQSRRWRGEGREQPFLRWGGRGAAWRGWDRLGMTKGTCMEHQGCFPKPRGKAPGSSIPKQPRPRLVCARSPLLRGDRPRAALVSCLFPGEPALVAALGEHL